MEQLVLCKLEGKEVSRTRSLYEEVFREDSKAFVDYYYENKAPGNTTFVLESSAHEIIAMLHLTPYTLCVRNKAVWSRLPAYYVVAVATKEQYRHHGCMRRLLEAAERHCNVQQVPFLFLMPADPAIYQPFGYAYCYARTEFYVNYREGDLPTGVCCMEVQTHMIQALTCFTNRWLRGHCDFFVQRTDEYYVNLMKELRAQNGSMYVFYFQNEVAGYYCRTGDGEPNMGCGKDCIQEAMLSEELCAIFERDGRKPPILTSSHRNNVIMGKCVRPVWDLMIQECGPVIGIEKRGWLTELV